MINRTKTLLYAVAGLLILLISEEAFSQTAIEVGKFSAARAGGKLPSDWKPLVFKKIEKHTTYTLVKDDDKVVVKAVAKAKLNQWVGEERNIYEDYKMAFREEPPLVSGVAIMTDTDNTGESATAYYKEG